MAGKGYSLSVIYRLMVVLKTPFLMQVNVLASGIVLVVQLSE